MSDSTQNPPPEGSVPPPGPDQGHGQGSYGQQPGGSYGAPPPPGGYAQVPGYGPPPTGADQRPELFMRFLARAIDNILVGIVVAIIASIIGVVFGLGSMHYGYSVGASYAASAVSGVIGGALYLAYFALMESRRGQTVGKMALKLRTTGPDGNPPTLDEAIRRNFWEGLGALAIIPLIGPLIGSLAELVIVIVIAVTVGQSPIGQGWHDRFAGGTRVIRAR
jgi:uncharacterized RDD family membrane protein YckC